MVVFTLLIVTKICEYLGQFVCSYHNTVEHPSMSVYDRYNSYSKFCLKNLDIKNP